MLNNRLLSCISWTLLAVCLGCGDADWGQVTGTVTLNGQPVGPGLITFEPANPESIKAPSAGGQFKEDGKYALHSPGNKLGAPSGEYLVRIQGHSGENFGEEGADLNYKSKIPTKYLDPYLSKLKATVKPGSQTIDFNLKP